MNTGMFCKGSSFVKVQINFSRILTFSKTIRVSCAKKRGEICADRSYSSLLNVNENVFASFMKYFCDKFSR